MRPPSTSRDCANLSYYFNSYTTITDRTPELLSTMDSLERVTFDACHGLTNAGVGALARLPQAARAAGGGTRHHRRGAGTVPAARRRTPRSVKLGIIPGW